MIDLFDELVRLVERLDEARVDYAVCGGVAVAVHGVPRATQDIDLLVLSADLTRAMDAATAAGFSLRGARMRFASSGLEMQRVTKVVGTEHLMVDFLLIEDASDAVWNSQVKLPLRSGGPLLRVVSRAALISLKLKAGRPQDLADVARLEEHE